MRYSRSFPREIIKSWANEKHSHQDATSAPGARNMYLTMRFFFGLKLSSLQVEKKAHRAGGRGKTGSGSSIEPTTVQFPLETVRSEVGCSFCQ